MPLSAAEELELSTLAHDLRFIFSERDVPDELQLLVVRAGYRTLGLYQAMVDNRTELRASLKADFDLDAAAAGITAAEALYRRTNLARLVDAWTTCSRRQEEHDRVQATQTANRFPLTVPRATLISLRQRYEKDYGVVKDMYWPNHALVERRLEEVEEGEVKNDMLTEMVSIDEVVEDLTTAVVGVDGSYRTRRLPKSIPLPKTPEELRIRIRMLGVTFQLASYKHGSRLWLQGCSPKVWLDHAEFVLGDDVARMEHKVLDVIIQPPWSVVLGYEFQLRKLAIKKIMFEDMKLEDALMAARADTACKEKFFSTPTAMAAAVGGKYSAKRANDNDIINGMDLAARQAANRLKRANKGTGKSSSPSAKSKGKGKQAKGGKAKKFIKAIHSKSPDGRNLCHRFQVGLCSNPSCGFVHMCSQCLGDHSAENCPTSPLGQ